MLRRGLIVLMAGLLALLPAGCYRQKPEVREKLYVFGTLVEIIIRGMDKDTAREALAAVNADFQKMHKDWHAWKPGEMSRLNTAFAEGRAMVVSPFLLPLVKQAKTLESASGGLFNPAIGNMVAAWGFHADELPKGAPPPREKIARLVKARPSMSAVRIDGNKVSSSNPAVSLDFGGFAKGAALDAAAKTLKRFGIRNAILNAGGDLNVIGTHGERPWRLGIRHPKSWGVLASVELKPDEVLYTSGNYERFFEHEGVRYAHIIDPRTGWPVNHIVSASVVGVNGAAADAAATALTVAGPDDWHRVAKRMGVKFALLVDDEGTLYLNPAMQARLVLEEDKAPKLVLSPPL